MAGFHVDARAFRDALKNANGIVKRIASSPATSLTHLTGDEHGLTVAAWSMDEEYATRVSADVTGAVRVAFNADALAASLAGVERGTTLQVEVEPKALTVTAGRLRARATLADESEYRANVAALDGDEKVLASLTMPGGAMSALLRASYAAAVQDFQAVFRYARLEVRPDTVRCVGTDGFRLAYVDATAETDAAVAAAAGGMVEAFIPSRQVANIRKVLTLAGDEAPARLVVTKARALLEVGAERLVVVLGEGSYPDYQRIFPSSFGLTVNELDAAAFLGLLRRVEPYADPIGNHRVDVTLDARKAEMRVAAEGPMGRVEDVMAVTLEGTAEEARHAYNAAYLRDAVANANADKLVLRVTGFGNTPSVVTADGYTAVVVPLRAE